ncbi:hypothetical protein [Agitococcus lubricus]|nr:hypothetical protein [Agitococcus lubricus]
MWIFAVDDDVKKLSMVEKTRNSICAAFLIPLSQDFGAFDKSTDIN